MEYTLVVLACAAVAAISGVDAQSSYDPDSQNVYHLFTRLNPTVSQPMLYGWPTLIAPNFSTARRTVFILHGWDSGPTSAFNVALIPAVLATADVNLIAVDWSAGAAETDYDVLINSNVPRSGESIARFALWLNEQTGATLDQYHIIGFEVGSHMGGILGRNLNGQVPFVTALNPPRQGWNASNMFRPTDGGVTEAIHTDIFGTGMMEPVANIDIYPNGGLLQPGCFPLDWECSKDRAFEYFAESIISGGFSAARCATALDAVAGNCDPEDTIPMGGLSNKLGISGYFHVTTNAQAPFSTG